MSFRLFNCSSLSCIILALSPAVTNRPTKTLIFHDFQGRKIKFHDVPGLENEILKFHDFPGFPWPVRTLFHLVIRQRLSIARACFNTVYFWNETWHDLLFCIVQLTQHFYNYSTCVSPTLLLLANDRHVTHRDVLSSSLSHFHWKSCTHNHLFQACFVYAGTHRTANAKLFLITLASYDKTRARSNDPTRAPSKYILPEQTCCIIMCRGWNLPLLSFK